MTTQLAAFKRTLSQSHRIRTVVGLYDHEERYLATLDEGIISGQVDVDTKRDIERSLSLVLADVNKRLSFDSGGDDERALYADRFIRIDYQVWTDELRQWHREPVFFGPVTRFERDGFQVTIEAQDKSSLLHPPVVWGRHLRNAGLGFIDTDTRYAAEMMRAILATTGEAAANMEFGSFENARLPKDFKLPKHPENVWLALKRIVRAANARSETDRFHDFRLFYDGRGRLRVESMSTGGFIFTDDPSTGVLLDKPQVNYDQGSFANTVVVKVNRGQDGRPLAPLVRTLASWHPLSARNLGRNGKPRFIVKVIDNNNIRTRAHAREVARSELRKASTETVVVSFNCLPIPHLTPGARCRLVEDENVHHFTASRFTIPLRAADSMSVGYLKRVRTGTARQRVLHVPAKAFR